MKRIETRNFAEVIEAEGTLTNPGYIQLTPQGSGLITEVLVKEGDRVVIEDDEVSSQRGYYLIKQCSTGPFTLCPDLRRHIRHV